MNEPGVRSVNIRLMLGFSVCTAVRPASAASVIEWQSVRHPGSTATVESVVFTASSSGWMLQRDGTVLGSADGGGTWAVRSRLGGAARRLAARPDGFLAVAGDGIGWTSTDAGRAWRESRLGTGGSFNAIAVGPDGACWVAGMGGEVHASRDHGVSWTARGRPALGHLFAVAAGPGVVLAGGLRGLWESRDGGVRWSYVNLDRIPERHLAPRPAIADLVVALDGVWVAGWLDDFAMLWRLDWANPTGAALVHHEDDYRYVRVLRGPAGLVWTGGRNGFFARSVDGGRRWSQEPPGLAGELRALALGPDGAVFAGGPGGALFRGRDPAVPAPARRP